LLFSICGHREFVGLADFDLREGRKMLRNRLRERFFQIFEMLDEAVALPANDTLRRFKHHSADPTFVEALLNPESAAGPSGRDLFGQIETTGTLKGGRDLERLW